MIDQNDNHRDPTQPIYPKRPILLTILLWVFIFWGAMGWLRFAMALMQRSLILEVLAPGLFSYMLTAGIINGLAALPVIWGFVRRTTWTPTVIKIMAVFYPGLYWLERVFLWNDPNAQHNWPFMLLLTVLWFGLVIWALRSKRSQRFFKQRDKGDE